MSRIIFRTKSLTANAVQVFLTRNQCILNGLREIRILTKYIPGKWKNSGSRKYLMDPKLLHGQNRNYFFVFGGLLSFFGLKPEGEEESKLITTIKHGILGIKRGQYQNAVNNLHEALQMAFDESNENGITYVYDVLANLYFDTGKFDKAEKLFINVMKRLLQEGYEASDNKMIHISLKLAKIYELTNDNVKAETGYRYCVDNLENKINVLAEDVEENVDTLKLWISTLDTYGRFLINLGRVNEAIIYLKKAFDMSIQVNGREHEDTALLLNDLGIASSILGNIETALSYIEEAVDIGKNLADMEHLQIIYINLGYLYLTKQMYNESTMACEKGLRIAKKNEDEDGTQKGRECLMKIKEIFERNKN